MTYANSLHGGFVMDSGAILRDSRIREVTGQNVALIWSHSYWWPLTENGLYRPLTTLTYLFNFALLGNAERPEGYHWLNLLLHAVNVLLAYFLGLRLSKRFWPAVAAAALWGVHPLLTESVANIAGRPDLLAAMAVLSGLLLYLRSKEAAGARKALWLATLAAVTLLGIFSKESAIALPAVIAAYELAWGNGQKSARDLAMGIAACAGPLALVLLVRLHVLGGVLGLNIPFRDNPLTGATFWKARLTGVKIMFLYLGKVLLPAELSCDYSFRQPLSRTRHRHRLPSSGRRNLSNCRTSLLISLEPARHISRGIRFPRVVSGF